MYFSKVRCLSKISPYSRFSSTTQKSKIGFVEHDIFSPEFKNVTQGAQKTEDKLFIYLSTGPKSILPIVRHDRNALLKTVSEVYKKCYEINPYLDTVVLFNFSVTESNLLELYPNINFFQYIEEPSKPSIQLCPEGVTTPTYPITCLGGTFDRLHIGHKVLLTAATMYATSECLIGISEEVLLRHKANFDMIQPYQTRENNLLEFVRFVKPSLNYTVVPITDVFGATVTRENIDALVVSDETLTGALKINDIRRGKEWKPIEIIQVGLLEELNSINGIKISSSSLREREKELRNKKE